MTPLVCECAHRQGRHVMSSFGLYRCFEQDCDCSTFEPVAPDSTNKPGEPTGGDSVALTAT